MKYRLIPLGVLLALFTLALSLAAYDRQTLLPRTQQHMEKEKENICSEQFQSHLPIVSIETENKEMPTIERHYYENGLFRSSSQPVSAVVTAFDSTTHYNQTSDSPSEQCAAQVRYRGHSSLGFEKSPYKINFIDASGEENKSVALLGMEPFDEWALHGPFLDRTLMRNYLCMNIAGQIMEYTPDVRFCELFVNGNYEGVYLAMETVAKGAGRVDLKTYQPGDSSVQYITRLNWYDQTNSMLDNFSFYAMRYGEGIRMEVIYPGEERLTQEAKVKIEQDISRFEKSLYSFDYDDRALGYNAYIDVNSFVDYFIINEFFANEDAGRGSTYFYKDAKGKLKIGPVWDFNSAINNYGDEIPIDEFVMVNKPYYQMLMRDQAFVGRVVTRYHELRKSILSEQYLLSYIKDTEAYLGDSITRNNERWCKIFDLEQIPANIFLTPAERNPQSYEQAVQDMQNYIVARGIFLDEHIDTMYQYCHESAVKKYNH